MRFLLAVLFLLPAIRSIAAEPVRVFAAGSLLAPLTEAIGAAGLPAGAVAAPVFGPAGGLRARIEGGEPADLFLSADTAQAERLAQTPGWLPPVPFARNRMCVFSREATAPEGVVAALTAPDRRVATSTPGNDPGGDYAWAVFDRIDAVQPGAGAALKAKALKLIGNGQAPAPVAGHSPNASIFLADRADAFLYYCSAAASTIAEVPGLHATPLPAALEPGPVYAMTVRPTSADAMRLALFLLSDPGQSILVRNGLLQVLTP